MGLHNNVCEESHVLQLCFEWYANTIVSCCVALKISPSSFAQTAVSFCGMRTTWFKSFATIKWHITKAAACSSLSMNLIPCVFLIFLDKWARQAFSQMGLLFNPVNDNSGLWTRRLWLFTENMESILFMNDSDVPVRGQKSEYRSSQGDKNLSREGLKSGISKFQQLNGNYTQDLLLTLKPLTFPTPDRRQKQKSRSYLPLYKMTMNFTTQSGIKLIDDSFIFLLTAA